ncbi:MAG TPA: hypothetical protein VJ692_15545 [Nitrospiraceae bacterium]|nr:hypothetical protein [Nitrospiraceae bacterium]
MDKQPIHAGVGPGRIGALIVLIVGCLSGCTTPINHDRRPLGEQLIGTSRQQLFACAGPPLREIGATTGAVLTYYREASMLEESHVWSKASRPGIHGGCRAQILMSDDRVSGVEYKPVPDALKATDQCEEMFRACVQ